MPPSESVGEDGAVLGAGRVPLFPRLGAECVREYVHLDKFIRLYTTGVCIFWANVTFPFKLFQTGREGWQKRVCMCFLVHVPSVPRVDPRKEVHLRHC